MKLPEPSSLTDRAQAALDACGVVWPSGDLSARSPITGTELRTVLQHSGDGVDDAVAAAHAAHLRWRTVPAPQRGAVVRRLGALLTERKEDLAELVTLEAGKITSEALGEVQEMIDICEFAVGLSRQLYGRTMPSERPGHRLMETWHPLGVVGVISAFNFPVAVWSWNTALALVCGDAVVWKPSETTPLTALACDALLRRALAECDAPSGVHQLVVGGRDVGQRLADNPSVPLVSATGSVRMGRALAPRVAARFGRSLLELGGNNGAVVTPSADLGLAVRAIVFSAAGTAGQRCTSLRRLIVHESIADTLVERIVSAYAQLQIGSPFESDVLVGPLIDEAAYRAMQDALTRARADGGTVLCGGDRVGDHGYYVNPAVVRMPAQTAVVRDETFAPILYVVTYRDFDEAMALHNAVPPGTFVVDLHARST
ncbi:aldehyde dehydrogenase (NAD+) [Rhodococcus sp. 27YEA15]